MRASLRTSYTACTETSVHTLRFRSHHWAIVTCKIGAHRGLVTYCALKDGRQSAELSTFPPCPQQRPVPAVGALCCHSKAPLWYSEALLTFRLHYASARTPDRGWPYMRMRPPQFSAIVPSDSPPCPLQWPVQAVPALPCRPVPLPNI